MGTHHLFKDKNKHSIFHLKNYLWCRKTFKEYYHVSSFNAIIQHLLRYKENNYLEKYLNLSFFFSLLGMFVMARDINLNFEGYCSICRLTCIFTFFLKCAAKWHKRILSTKFSLFPEMSRLSFWSCVEKTDTSRVLIDRIMCGHFCHVEIESS